MTTPHDDGSQFEGDRYRVLKIELASIGRRLYRGHRADDGRVTYFVDHWVTTRTYSTLHDVEGYLNSLYSLVLNGG